MQVVQSVFMLVPGFHNINAGGVYTAVPQQVCQSDNVFVKTVEGSGEKVAEIMWKHLSGVYPCTLAQGFHLPPDAAPVQGPAVFADKYGTGSDTGFFYILMQQFLNQRGDKYHPRFIFAVNYCSACLYSLCGDVLQLADPNAGAADRLDDIGDARSLRCPDQALIFFSG